MAGRLTSEQIEICWGERRIIAELCRTERRALRIDDGWQHPQQVGEAANGLQSDIEAFGVVGDRHRTERPRPLVPEDLDVVRSIGGQGDHAAIAHAAGDI